MNRSNVHSHVSPAPIRATEFASTGSIRFSPLGGTARLAGQLPKLSAHLANSQYRAISDSRIHVGKCRFGRGVFAARRLRRGEAILEFSGPLVSLDEALRKGAWSFNVLQVAHRAYIDIEEPGVLVNHSCEPNAGVRSGELLVALREIDVGEEITFDYSTTMSERRETMKCRCQAPSCRQIVGDFHDLPLDVRKRYLETCVVMDFIVREHYEGNRLKNGVATNRSGFSVV